MKTIQLASLSLLTIVAASLFGCQEGNNRACTEMGCSSTVTFILPELEEGNYQIQLEMNHLSAGCTFDIPLAEFNCSTDDELTVDSNGDVLVTLPMVDESTLEDSVQVYLYQPYQHDTSPLLDAEVAVDWSDPFYPNGEECDELACFNGTVNL